MSNFVTFHFSSWVDRPEKSSARSAFSDSSLTLGSKTFSEIEGMLLKFTVSLRETMVTAKVALSAGSSQQGKARRAAVG